jgi:hypothetical protein
VYQKFIEKVMGASFVIPVKTGIQKSFKFLDFGSRFLAKAGITPACPE